MTLTDDWDDIATKTIPITNHVRVPLITRVTGNLYMGGCLDETRLPSDFGLVIAAYQSEKYTLGENTRRFDYEMLDGPDVPAKEQLEHAARTVLTHMSASPDSKVLIHCQAGLNRSALITVYTMWTAGWSIASAIELLRLRRSEWVLYNNDFHDFLTGLDD
jgi:protein-tyrosine phosphatase